MGLVAVVLAAAVVLGWARGGRLARLGAVRVPGLGLLAAAVGVQALGAALAGGPLPGSRLPGGTALPEGAVHAAGLAVSAGLVITFLVRARRLTGLGLVALGFALNALVIGANGAMPVSAEAVSRAGADTGPLAAGPRHEVLDGQTRLPLLADVVPVPLPVRPEVVSAGDVLVAAGLGRLVLAGMRAPALSRAALTARRRPAPVAGSSGRNTTRRREGRWPSVHASGRAARRAPRTTGSGPTPDPVAPPAGGAHADGLEPGGGPRDPSTRPHRGR